MEARSPPAGTSASGSLEFVEGLGFRGLGFRGLGFRGLGFRGLGFRGVIRG